MAEQLCKLRTERIIILFKDDIKYYMNDFFFYNILKRIIIVIEL